MKWDWMVAGGIVQQPPSIQQMLSVTKEVTIHKTLSIVRRTARRASVFALAVLSSTWLATGFAQDSKINLNALIQETQKQSDRPDKMSLVWWIPEEFWEASLAQNANMTATERAAFIEPLRPYIVILAVDGEVGPLGGITYKPEPLIRDSIRIIDAQNVPHRPLPEEEINADTKNLILMMKPLLTKMLGPLGENMHFYFFSAQNGKGEKIAEARKEGSFTVTLGRPEFRFRLPLGSLLPVRTCPRDGERLSGAWRFCPWHGEQLVEATEVGL